MNIPYTGCGVVAAAVGMDKVMMKSVFKAEGLPIVPYMWFYRGQWAGERDQLIERAEAIGYPLVVKPANLGSSIGISKADDQAGLVQAIEVAMSYDRKVIIEKAILPLREINCAVMGRDADLLASVCEEPVTWENFLSYEDKYINGAKGGKGGKGMQSAKRRIPADIPDESTARIQTLAKDAFRAIDACGDARIDFLLSEAGEIYVNEINTLPGSMAFYLWEAGGISFKDLCTKQIELALAVHEEKQKNITSYNVKLYQRMGGGVKK
jgi:D-alanine-D-alanine ligase